MNADLIPLYCPKLSLINHESAGATNSYRSSNFSLPSWASGKQYCTAENSMLVVKSVNLSQQVSLSTVYFTIKRHWETGGNAGRKQSGHPKATTDIFLRENSLCDGWLTGQQLQAQLNSGEPVWVSTVKRRLGAAAWTDVRQRSAAWPQTPPLDYWSVKVLWTDESKF